MFNRPKSLIILPVWGAWDYVAKCVKSVVDNTIPEHYDICIIHNYNPYEDGEGDPTVNSFKIANLLPHDEIEVTVIFNDENKGVAKSWNQGLRHGMEHGGYDSFVLLNSDVIVFDQWLAHMRKLLNSERPPPCIQTFLSEGEGSDYEAYNRHCKQAEEKFVKGKGLNGPCFMLTRQCVESVGYFDEKFLYGFYEDADYLMRLRQLGATPIVAYKAFVHHFHAASRSRMPDFDSYRLSNKRYFETKWSVNMPESYDCKGFPSLSELRQAHGYVVS